MALHARLLHDLAEIEQHPYENIMLIPRDEDFRTACLILNPSDQDPLHFTVFFQDDYPLKAPSIRIDSSVRHPNVFGTYICASILNTDEGWTPAYTIKGIAIQLLSFFSSDTLEQQSYGRGYREQDLRQYRLPDGRWEPEGPAYKCSHCNYYRPAYFPIATSHTLNLGQLLGGAFAEETSQSTLARRSHATNSSPAETAHSNGQIQTDSIEAVPVEDEQSHHINDMPDEILVRICEQMDTEDLMVFARAWNRIGSATGIITQFNLLRNRELQCFVLKKSFKQAELGVGVRITRRGRQSRLTSEFDLLSLEAFTDHGIHQSVQGLPFTHFLPLPISRRHYQGRSKTESYTRGIAKAAQLDRASSAEVIIAFMNDIVVTLCDLAGGDPSGSALTRASERAIESYYHLFHLLLCLASEDVSIVRSINRKLSGVLNGQANKEDVPNLGHLLIGTLIADVPMSETLLIALVKEAITRNVVWMLDPEQGKGMADLAYLEANAISHYRLQRTFEASRTSYTLLMFQNTFRQVINRSDGTQRKSILQMRDELFDSHGAPPRGTAARLSNRLRQLQSVTSFPTLIRIMGIEMPKASVFTGMLRSCLINSVKKGYSKWGISQSAALQLRRVSDPFVEVRTEWSEETNRRPPNGPDKVTSFFPATYRRGAGIGTGTGRGRSRGSGRGRGY